MILGFFLLIALVLGLYGYHGYWTASRQNAFRAAMANEQWDKALPKLIDLSNDPNSNRFVMLNNIVICYLGLEKPDDALIWLNKWTSEDKESNPIELYGRAYFQKKDYKKSAEYFNRILDKNKLDPSANFHTGAMLFLEGKMAEAGQRFARAAADPKYDAKAQPYRDEMMKRLLAGETATTATTTVK